jgi:hypothetical protein
MHAVSKHVGTLDISDWQKTRLQAAYKQQRDEFDQFVDRFHKEAIAAYVAKYRHVILAVKAGAYSTSGQSSTLRSRTAAWTKCVRAARDANGGEPGLHVVDNVYLRATHVAIATIAEMEKEDMLRIRAKLEDAAIAELEKCGKKGNFNDDLGGLALARLTTI